MTPMAMMASAFFCSAISRTTIGISNAPGTWCKATCGGGTIAAQLARSVFDEALDVIRIEAAGDDDEIAFAENHARIFSE